MPRETIADEVGCFDVKIGWIRDCYVQLGVEMREPSTSDSPQNLKQLVASWQDESQDPDHPYGALGLWSTLGRREINQLIRVLRRARDQAFGKDE